MTDHPITFSTPNQRPAGRSTIQTPPSEIFRVTPEDEVYVLGVPIEQVPVQDIKAASVYFARNMWGPWPPEGRKQ